MNVPSRQFVNYGCNLILLTHASPSPITANAPIPSADSVHISESMKIPPSIGTFVILIANEAHENWSDERHKLITDKNSYYLPTNIIIPNGTAIAILHTLTLHGIHQILTPLKYKIVLVMLYTVLAS